MGILIKTWGYSSVGRAFEWHSKGQRFETAYLHQEGTFVSPFFYFSVEISIRRKVRKIYNNYLKNEKLSKQIAKIKKTIEYSQRLFQNI